MLQLLIESRVGGDESWTAYRHQKDRRKDGKIVFKKWNREADMERLRALGSKKAPKNWETRTNIIEKQLPVSGRWVKDLGRALATISVPPIAGSVLPLARTTKFRLTLWRSRQQSEFSWDRTTPKGWRPLGQLFDFLLQSFRRHAEGKALAPVREL